MTTKVATISTEEAAAKVGISYITLRRWLAFGAPQARDAFATEKGLVVFEGKASHRFTANDIKRLAEYKDLYYQKGRGRSTSPDAKRWRNSWKSWKRIKRRYNADKNRLDSARQEHAADRDVIRRYEAAVHELHKALATMRERHMGPSECPFCKTPIA